METSGVGLKSMQSKQKPFNNNFVCHVIRDVFPKREFTVVYDRSNDLTEEMHTQKHGIGALRLHSEMYSRENYSWALGTAGIYFGSVIDLFVSINYDPIHIKDLVLEIAKQLKESMKQGGIVFLVNPGHWADRLGEILLVRSDLEKEVKKYSFLKDEDVRVYENI